MACGDVLSLEDLQIAKKHQIFEAEVITGKAGGVAGGTTIGTATNPVTGQTQQTLPSILADLGFDVQSWTSSTGGVLASANQVFLNDTPGSLGLGDYYAWGGNSPKTVPAGVDPALPNSGYVMRSSRFATTQAREALRRSYAEAGYNMVSGSFESGGTLVKTNDVLLQERTGKSYSGQAGTVSAGTNPASGGFVDRSGALLRGVLTPITYGSVADMVAGIPVAAGVGDLCSVYDYYGGGSPNGSGVLFFKAVAVGTGVADGGAYIDGNGVQFKQNLKKPYDPTAWGARGDFNKATGVGTDNRPFIQATIDYAQTKNGSVIEMPAGNFYLGTSRKPGSNVNLEIQLLIGSIWSENKPYVTNIEFRGNGTNLFAGRAGRILTFGKTDRGVVSGFGFYHYVGGVITGQRGISDNAVRVCDGCKNIDIHHNYMTNHLGWGVDITSDSENPASNNYLCRDINIFSNKIKTRYGNGTRAYNTLAHPTDPQGTGGAWCIAVINGEGVDIYDNHFIGNIDLENNATLQTFNNISIRDNRFTSGWVTPQTVIGSNYWDDEPENAVGAVGAVELKQGVLFNGVGLNVSPKGVSVFNNTFENGEITLYANYKMSIVNNDFTRGRINVGYEQSGEQSTTGVFIADNRAKSTPDPDPFILIKGFVPDANMPRNNVEDRAVNVIGLKNAAGRSAFGQSDYSGNRLLGPVAVTSVKTYRVTVTPFMTPTVTLTTTVALSAGAGSGVLSLLCSGLGKTGTTQTYDVIQLAKGTPGGTVSFSTVTKFNDGVFIFDVTISASSGTMSFSSPDGYALISVATL